MNTPMAANMKSDFKRPLAALPLPICLTLLALAGALGCSKEKPVTFEPPPEPKVEGEKVTFLTNAPQLA
jgi:hypothetical protein